MGHAASLFFSSNGEHQTLYRRCRPNDAQYAEQQQRWNDLAAHVLAELRKATSCVSRSWLQGSYKFGTQIRPAQTGDEFDIDLGVYVEWAGAPEDGDCGPSELQRLVQNSLNAFAASNSDIEKVTPIKERCCRIRFSGDFHIDLPAYHLDPERDRRSLATKSDKWENSDPKAIYLWFKNKFGDYDRAKVRRQVIYGKMWAALKCEKEFRPSSILLTVLIADAYDDLSEDDRQNDDDCFASVMSAVRKRLERDMVVKNPVDPDENLNRLPFWETQQFIEALEGLEAISVRALSAGSKVDAADIWSEAFDQFFPGIEGEDDGAPSGAAKALAPMQFVPEVAVTATTESKPAKTYSGMNRIGPIPKKCTIDFHLQNAQDLPLGATVHWMVRNEGEEAERINDLGHRVGEGQSARENSAYKGTHYMDVVVKRFGAVLGRRRIPVQIHGIAMPDRNPLTRPL